MSKFLIVLSTCVFIVAAHATPITQNFTFTTAAGDGGVTYTGVLNFDGITDPFNSRAIDITTFGGTINGQSISLVSLIGSHTTKVSSVDSSDLFFADNVFYTRGFSHFDAGGLLFTDGTNLYNFVGGGVYVWVPSPAPGRYLTEVPLDLTPPPAVAPEPTTLALCGTGILAIAGIARRKRVRS